MRGDSTPTVRLRKVVAGVYETEDGQHRLVRSVHEGVGPRGGPAVVWEHAEPYLDNDWCIDGLVSGARLSDAAGLLAERLEANRRSWAESPFGGVEVGYDEP